MKGNVRAQIKKNVSGWPWEQVETPAIHSEQLPKISIVVPLYNHGEYIEETLRSILLQNYPNLELVVMDGGSVDKSVEILKYYDEYITYWESKKDKGQSDAINKGFERCTGDIITFQQSDDKYLPGTFHAVARLYNEHQDAGVIAGGFYFMDAHSRRISDDIPPYLQTTTPADLTLGPPNLYRVHQVATFYKKEALGSVGRFVRDDLHYTMDRELLYRVIKHYPARLTESTFGAFRKHLESKSTHSIIPFAREFADLYLESRTGNYTEDNKREVMAKHRLYRGYIQLAKTAEKQKEKMFALWNAWRLKPFMMFNRSFLALFVRTILSTKEVKPEST